MCRYDLYGVINHFGSMAAGHYTAACRVPLGKGKEDWCAPSTLPSDVFQLGDLLCSGFDTFHAIGQAAAGSLLGMCCA